MKKGLSLSLSLTCSLIGSPALAQVIPDDTVNTRVTENGNVSEINGGETRGTNLFHSFREFSVRTGNEALFNNAEAISNIFSRVTGGNISNIDGLIRANGSANLFLLNPAGIIFGEGARLDIGGSFYGSTADSILFPNDIEFSATDTQAQPVLTVNAPVGLNFRDNPGDITVRGDGQGTRTTSEIIDTENALRVDSDETFALLGGNINLEGATIKTAGGRIELGSVDSNEQVNLAPTNGSFNFDYEGVQNFRDVQLTQTATVDASGEGGGNIRVQGRNITLTDGSRIEASTLGSLPGRNLDVIASETVELTGFNSSLIDTGLFSQVYSEASGTGGNITISSKNLNIVDGAEVQGNTFSSGNAGDITFNASESINISSLLDFSQDDFDQVDAVFTLINSGVASEATGNGGTITVDSQNFTFVGNVQLSSDTNGEGNAGNVFISASEFVELRDNPFIDTEFASVISSDVNSGAQGDGGNLTIQTQRLSLTGEDGIIANGTRGSGDGGDTFIQTSQLIIEGGAELQSLGFGLENEGDVGNITIEASDFVRVGGIFTTVRTIAEDNTPINTDGPLGGIFASAIGGGTGDGGNLIINTDRLIVEDFGTISVSNFQTLDLIPPGRGAAGNLEINANSVEVDNGTIDIGNANGIGGNLTLNANSLTLSNGGDILAETTADTGVGGNIDLNVDEVVSLRDNSRISARATGDAIGGNIDIDADFVVAFPSEVPNDGNDILADGQNNESGQILIDADAVLGFEVGQETPGNGINDIDFFSNFEAPDTRTIQPPEIIEPDVETPEVVEAEQVETQACSGGERIARGDSSLIITGKGGVAPQPTEPLNSDAIIVDGQTTTPNLQSQHHDIKPIKTQYGDIIPARGIIKTEDGRVILTAYPTDNTQRTSSLRGGC